MKILIAIITCQKFTARSDAQRATWVPLVKGADVHFFLGGQERDPLPDEVFLDCPDDYHSLPLKVQLMVVWALAHGYDRVCKLDDDSYVFPDKLMDSIPGAEHAGHVNGTPPVWISGFAYWLGPKAMQIVASSKLTDEPNEDRWVSAVLRENGIFPVNIPHFVVADEIPRWKCIDPDTIAACEFDEKEMLLVHNPPGGWQARKQRIDHWRAKGVRIMRGDGKPFC